MEDVLSNLQIPKARGMATTMDGQVGIQKKASKYPHRQNLQFNESGCDAQFQAGRPRKVLGTYQMGSGTFGSLGASASPGQDPSLPATVSPPLGGRTWPSEKMRIWRGE